MAAIPEGDGLNHGNAPISTATIPPVEILEAAYPVMFTRWSLRPDSGGAGQSRGGLGAIYEIELLEEQADVFLFGERGRFSPPGVLGGDAGALNRFTAVRTDGSEQTPPMASKWVGVKLARGDRVRLETPGGGGYGPADRRPAMSIKKRYRERLRHARRGGPVLRHESRRMKRQLVIGVDVGGTFTDLFFLDEATGRSWIGKVPSTRGREADGFLKGIREGAGDLAQVATVVHGTTVGTNALLERKGGRTGIIATEGFRDVLEMRRRDRPQTWGLWGQFEPVVPRDRRLEVRERVLADGTIRTAVDPEEVVMRARELLARGAEAVAVTFVNAYANGQNERAAAQALKTVWPNAYVNVSSEILPEIREFERTSTTVLNAYLQPVVADYLDRLEAALSAQGFGGQLLIVQSNGGVMTIEIAKARPVRTALSGPAAGVIAAAHIAESAGFPNVVTGDVGGTSFDVSLIAGGRDDACRADIDRFRSGRAHADDRDHDHRRRRRLDRLGRSRRAAAGGAGIGGRGAWPGLLRPGQRAADADRRQRGSRAHQCGTADRRRARRVWMSKRRGRPSRSMSASRSASTRRLPRRRSSASPTAAWPERSGWSRSSAATIRATLR